MEDVIRKIISIEEKAQKVIDNALQEKVDRKKELQEKLEELKEKLTKDAQKKITQLKKMEIEETNKEAELLMDNCAKRLVYMEEYYNKNKEKWKDSLLKNVLEG